MRILLLAHYWKKDSLSESERLLHQANLLWIIRRHPSCDILTYPEAQLDPVDDEAILDETTALWLTHTCTSPDDAAMLANAAAFFRSHDQDRCQQLLERAQGVDPLNSEWYEQLADLFHAKWLNETSVQRRNEFAASQLAQLKYASFCSSQEHQSPYLLSLIASAAYEASEFTTARSAAARLVEYSFTSGGSLDVGIAQHYGHLVMGRLALRDGDLGQAKLHLIQAGKIIGSPALSSFGPNMMLASELLAVGECAIVLEFLLDCTRFWEAPNHELQQWMSVIERGGIPQFGASLYL